MKDTEFTALLNADHQDVFLVNGKYKWRFFDELTFTEFVRDENSPSSSATAEGIVDNDAARRSARVVLQKHPDLNLGTSGCICFLGNNGEVTSLENIISATKISS